MDLKIILIYCVCADFLKEIGHLSNHSQRMPDNGLFPKKIHAVVAKGFEIKVLNFILAYTFALLFKEKCALA